MDKLSVARFLGLIVVLLAYFNINVPGDVVEAVTMIIVAGWALWSAWKNNNLTKKAVEKQKILDEMESEK